VKVEGSDVYEIKVTKSAKVTAAGAGNAAAETIGGANSGDCPNDGSVDEVARLTQ
jgi:hypothetical protein